MNEGDLRDVLSRLSAVEAEVRDLRTQEVYGDDVVVLGFLRLAYAGELTIAAGVITATGAYHSVDTEGGAGTDDLDTVNGGTEGDVLVLRADDSARTVVCKDGTGNLRLAGGDFSLDHVEDRIALHYDGTNWCELTRADNS